MKLIVENTNPTLESIIAKSVSPGFWHKLFQAFQKNISERVQFKFEHFAMPDGTPDEFQIVWTSNDGTQTLVLKIVEKHGHHSASFLATDSIGYSLSKARPEWYDSQNPADANIWEFFPTMTASPAFDDIAKAIQDYLKTRVFVS